MSENKTMLDPLTESALVDITKEPSTGQSIFDFMADIKIGLNELFPDSSACVEPHGKRIVRVRMEWKSTDLRWRGAQQFITVEEIVNAKYDVVAQYLAVFKTIIDQQRP